MFYANNINNLVRVWRLSTDRKAPLCAEWVPASEKTQQSAAFDVGGSGAVPDDLFLHERVW